MDAKQALKNRLGRLEIKLGIHVPETQRVDGEQWWSCRVRFGHQQEDFAEACRLAGLPTDLPGIVMMGEIPPSQVPFDFVPSIKRTMIDSQWVAENVDAVA